MRNKTVSASLLLLSLVAAASQAHADPVDGFRSAKFGADEKTVVQAAIKDLRVTDKDIQRIQDPSMQVTVLSVNMKNFAPLNMPATVNYVLGYKCNCLTQATVEWKVPDSVTPAQRGAALTGVAALVGHFSRENWGKDETVLNRVTGEPKEGSENAVVFFHGQNKKGGSAVTLIGAPVKMAKDKNKPDAMTANVDGMKAVSLVYERDAVNPDVRKIDVSQF
jgi:hypothetical protein